MGSATARGPRRIALWLTLFALAGAGLWFVPDLIPPGPLRMRFDPAAWLAEHGARAEIVSRRMLDAADPGAVEIPPELEPFGPRRVGDAVLFRVVPGGFAEPDQGMAYAPTGEAPIEGLRGDDRRWRHLRGHWWCYALELP